MRLFSLVLSASLSLIVAGCATSHPQEVHHAVSHAHDEPRPYDETADARADLNAALARAKASDKMTLLVMGANWCHDSRGLAAQFEKPRFQTLIKDHYELVYVDVGQKNRNIDIAQDYGLEHIVGTPTVFVIDTEGKVLNFDTAPTWRNAASRSEGEIWDYFRNFAHPRR